ncbi:MAG TPA: hypothetical protein PKE16_09705 [Hyphomicrobium sp.]|nr:hypothetical protein [Hyphomicrobium sp.]
MHFRFLQKATEAMFEMGQASVAAALACQKRLYDEMTPEALRPPEPATWTSWFGDWTPAPPTRPSARMEPQTDIMQSWLAMATACSAYWSGGQFAPAARTLSPAQMIMPPAVQAFWGVTPWTFYQGPMVAMMLSYGVPYAVAAPTARASTSAMDAADAACTQWRLVFGSAEGQRSLERNIRAAPSRWPTYLH